MTLISGGHLVLHLNTLVLPFQKGFKRFLLHDASLRSNDILISPGPKPQSVISNEMRNPYYGELNDPAWSPFRIAKFFQNPYAVRVEDKSKPDIHWGSVVLKLSRI